MRPQAADPSLEASQSELRPFLRRAAPIPLSCAAPIPLSCAAAILLGHAVAARWPLGGRDVAAEDAEEGGDLFDVRQAILGHLQQGGDPSPYDRILAIRLARLCTEYLIKECLDNNKPASFIGLQKGKVEFVDMARWPEMVDNEFQRPQKQWWMNLRYIAKMMSAPPEGMEY